MAQPKDFVVQGKENMDVHLWIEASFQTMVSQVWSDYTPKKLFFFWKGRDRPGFGQART